MATLRIVNTRCLLRQIRESRGMSQVDLAAKIGTTKNRVSNWENNVNVMTLESAVLVSLALKCDISDLYEFEISWRE